MRQRMQCHRTHSLLRELYRAAYVVNLVACRFPGITASYHALLDVADNELVAEAQARLAARL